MKKPAGGLFAALLFAGALAYSAQAAEFPPPPPTTYYGPVQGAQAGDGIVSFVFEGATGTACGDGVVLTESGAEVYVVDAITDAQKAGCAKAGRTVRFYLPFRRALLEPIVPSGSGGSYAQSLTLGLALTQRSVLQLLAGDSVPMRTTIPPPSVATGTPTPTASASPTAAPPTATRTPTPVPDVFYANCTAVRNAGKAPLYRGQPGYSSALDGDGDGIACE